MLGRTQPDSHRACNLNIADIEQLPHDLDRKFVGRSNDESPGLGGR